MSPRKVEPLRQLVKIWLCKRTIFPHWDICIDTNFYIYSYHCSDWTASPLHDEILQVGPVPDPSKVDLARLHRDLLPGLGKSGVGVRRKSGFLQKVGSLKFAWQ